MEEEDFEELPALGSKWSWRCLFIDILDVVSENLKMHQNYKVYEKQFQEQASLEIETITEG